MPQIVLWQLDMSTGTKVKLADAPVHVKPPAAKSRVESFDRGDPLLGAVTVPRPPRRPPRVPGMPPAEVVGRDVIAFRPD